MNGVEGLLRRERVVLAVGLALLALLAWAYLWRGAGTGMSAMEMTALSLFPHRLPDMQGDAGTMWPIAALMWSVMMVAMMTPSAAPLVLLYGRVLRGRQTAGGTVYASPAILLGGYLLVWLMFALAAAAVQGLLQPAGLISEMMLWSRSATLSALVLAAAGIYQFSPLKRACLAQCRGPVQFLTRYWRPGPSGAFLLGVRHGAYCIGCCWVLMALLFVGGAMNLVWIAVLTGLVLAERLLPAGERFGKLAGSILLLWALATLLV